MLSPFLKRVLIDILLVLSLVFSGLYIKIVFLDYLISLFHFFDMVNISSVAYIIQRVLLMIVPLIMLTLKTKLPRIVILKYIFIAIGVCYFLGNTWVIFFLQENSISTLLTASIPTIFTSGALRQEVIEAVDVCYQFQYNNAYVFNYLVWASYDLFGVLFSTIQGILFILLGLHMNSRKKVVLNKFLLVIVVSLVVPILYYVIIKANFSFPSEWGTRNLLVLASCISTYFAMKLASSSTAFWMDILY